MTITTKIYKTSDTTTLIDSSTTPGDGYLLEDLVEDNYVYKVEEAGKGTIIDFIEIPNSSNYGTGTSGTVRVDQYDACPSTTINVADYATTGIAALNVQVDNIELADSLSGVYTGTDLPQNTSGCIIKVNAPAIFSTTADYDDAYETFIDKVVFPLDLNTRAITLSKAFDLYLNFENADGTVQTNNVTTIRFKYNYTNGEFSSWTTITRSGSAILIPKAIAHHGEITLEILTAIGGVALVAGQEVKTIIGNNTGNAVNIDITVTGGVMPES